MALLITCKKITINILILCLILVCASSCKKKKTEEKNEEDPTPVEKFEVTTSSNVTGITGARATLNGEVTAEGNFTVTEKGFCGGLSPMPLLTSINKIAVGNGSGTYSTTYNGFLPNTTYYVRAYAINSSQDTSYGNQISFTTTDLTFGDKYQGGYVFYLTPGDPTHGLVCTVSNISSSSGWGISNVNVSTNTTNGSGQANTNAIIMAGAVDENAAYECDEYTNEGYSDWYLPSRDELVLMHTNLSLNGYGNFTATPYWSSSQSTTSSGSFTPQELAITVDFPGGLVSTAYRANNYPTTRAIRTF